MLYRPGLDWGHKCLTGPPKASLWGNTIVATMRMLDGILAGLPVSIGGTACPPGALEASFLRGFRGGLTMETAMMATMRK